MLFHLAYFLLRIHLMTKKHHHQEVHRVEPNKDEKDIVHTEQTNEENSEIERLRKRVESLQSALTKNELELSQTRESMLRSLADLENYRKRFLKERSEVRINTILEVIENLLPVLDNFEIGIKSAETSGNSGIVSGLQMILKQFQNFLSSYGISEISSSNEPFDMNIHDCIRKVESSDYEKDTVISVERKGYKLNDKLIRPAAVVVACPIEKDDQMEN